MFSLVNALARSCPPPRSTLPSTASISRGLHSPTRPTTALARLAAAGILAPVIRASALLSFGRPPPRPASARSSPTRRSGLVPLAIQAGAVAGSDTDVLLFIAEVGTGWGRARLGQPDELVPANIRDLAALPPRAQFIARHKGKMRANHTEQARAALAWLTEFLVEWEARS